MTAGLVLASHALCPYVQRAAIVLDEKGVAFERRDVDLADKPAWFTRISPLGKTPVLLVEGRPIFESAVICEYLDETLPPRLLPADPLERARHRAWVEFGSALLGQIAAFYGAADDAALARQASALRGRLEQLEAELGAGPLFAGDAMSLVDAAFAPVFRYFDAFDRIADFGWLAGLPKLRRWRRALAARPSVAAAVRPDHEALLLQFIERRGGALSRRLAGARV